ncbi:hypothetical protein GQ55_4G354100 [Panicum hallii var. hallii]|uniref:Uncharacterized protein n=1 Tax=Panicum hallii var. hallii TaxID=1504633 RepID=A0A2T7E3K4_9POAL|nr:hypothetical protein GQ55_4G354100 [Panicum hallii var. hallii]
MPADRKITEGCSRSSQDNDEETEIVFCIKRIFAGPVPEKKPMNHRTRENGGSLCTLHSKSPFDPEEGNT